jgi:opacity protein-like surface antigen
MHRHLVIIARLALGLTAAAAPLAAQDMGGTRAVTFGIAGGASLPAGGNLGDGVGTGFNVTGSLGFSPMTLPVGLQFDLGYNGFEYEGVSNESLRILSGTANAIIAVPTGGGIRPYLIGGVGIYNADYSSLTDAQTDFGLNAGGGLEFQLSGFRTFVEARLHSVFTEGSNSNFVPVVFGIKF